jgi:stage V sporulation protein S
MDVLRVAANSNPNSVAGALTWALKDQDGVEIHVVGAGAINQAVKAVAIARGFIAPSGMDLVCTPAFANICINGEDRTGIKLMVSAKREGA